MEVAAIARSPGHISGYFRRITGSTPGETGSCGAGIVIDEGVMARAIPAPAPAVKIVSSYPLPVSARIPLIETAMESLGVSAEVTTGSILPPGAGFGLSAAALLASISALSALFDLGLPDREIASLAHEIEVTHRTGLGDVAACQGGGIECREGAGVGAGIIRIPGGGQVIHAVTLGPILTPVILGDPARMAQIDRAFPGRCPRDIGDFFSLSRSFAGRSGLVTPRVAEALAACDRSGIPASMTMLGEGVFALGEEAAPVLAPFGKVHRLRVADHGFTPGEVAR
jgi:pantoate kinase